MCDLEVSTADLELQADDVEAMENDLLPVDEDFEEKREDELSVLRGEIEILRAQLKEREELDKANERLRAELADFYEVFPDTPPDQIPSEIWEKVRKGASLSAEYSLLLRRRELEKKRIGDINEKNRRMSAGSVNSGEGEKYYSPSEVKRMSPTQVKAHYDDIIESMRHWN